MASLSGLFKGVTPPWKSPIVLVSVLAMGLAFFVLRNGVEKSDAFPFCFIFMLGSAVYNQFAILQKRVAELEAK